MRLNELVGKEVIDLNGKKLGKIKKADIVMEATSGQIESIILHNSRFTRKSLIVIPWYSIKEIGSKTVLVDNQVIKQ
jgi:YlmC/YmxH family sporulation protein